MVKAEFGYNPYVRDISIRFNGQEPHINSRVEKYSNTPLREWIDQVPKIFHDEMNGYDFDLEFSGTAFDFEELKKAFSNRGISDEMVRLLHKNELASRNQISESIDRLLSWLNDNRNSHFDYEEFRNDNKELFDSKYPLIVINGRIAGINDYEDAEISVEEIDSLEELNSTNLENTPILIYVDRALYEKLHGILDQLLEREDISKRQLFFIVDPMVSKEMVKRILVDLGIKSPQMIQSIGDDLVQRYMEQYCISDYAFEALRVLRSEVRSISDCLDQEYKISAENNREIYEKLDQINGFIEGLKRSVELFEGRDKLMIPESWTNEKTGLLSSIDQWKGRKTKINKVEEAGLMASEFDSDIQKGYRTFIMNVSDLFAEMKNSLDKQYLAWYEQSGATDGYIDTVAFSIGDHELMPSLRSKFLELKEEKYVEREDILGLFRKNDSSPKMTLETTFLIQDWRRFTLETIEPLTDKFLEYGIGILQEYDKNVSQQYVDHINEVITEQSKEKEIVSAQLSEDEKNIQRDHDWLRMFADQVDMLERGQK